MINAFFTVWNSHSERIQSPLAFFQFALCLSLFAFSFEPSHADFMYIILRFNFPLSPFSIQFPLTFLAIVLNNGIAVVEVVIDFTISFEHRFRDAGRSRGRGDSPAASVSSAMSSWSG